MVRLDKCNQSCNAFDDLSRRICVASKTEYINLNIFNIIARMNEPKTLTKHILCDCKWKLDCRKGIWKQKRNNNKCQFKCKNPIKYQLCKKQSYLEPQYIRL